MQVHGHRVRELVFGADWACAHGDPGGLCDAVRQLSTRVPELRGELAQIARCDDPFAAWAAFRTPLVEHLRDDPEREPAGSRC